MEEKNAGQAVEQNQDKAILAMYDVRGIQNYIFKSNKVKEIIGASRIVDNVIEKGLKKIIDAQQDKDKYIVEWDIDIETNKEMNHESGLEFIDDSTIMMQVLFVGGGNAYVLYRNKKIYSKFSRELSQYVLENTYSLNLAVACIEKTDSYANDYNKINDEMSRIKSEMLPFKPMGALPHMATDNITGDVLTHETENGYISTESFLKLKAYNEIINSESEEDGEDVKQFEKMVTKKGEDSLLAVVHIDGNNMGKRIKKIMETKETYEDAISSMRRISKNIKDSFCEVFDNVRKEIKDEIGRSFIRKIVLAGDDITFVCNAHVALKFVTRYIEEITKKSMYGSDDTKFNFSVCAGIAYIHSHFPFSDAYVVAEECCESAKHEAKANKIEGMIGNYVDFQLCDTIKAGNLTEYREKNYRSLDGTWMILRPYFVETDVFKGKNENLNRSIEIFYGAIKTFNGLKNENGILNRSFAKRLKNTYYLGEEEVNKYVTFLKSRGFDLLDGMYVEIAEKNSKNEKIGKYYDALELIDIEASIEA